MSGKLSMLLEVLKTEIDNSDSSVPSSLSENVKQSCLEKVENNENGKSFNDLYNKDSPTSVLQDVNQVSSPDVSDSQGENTSSSDLILESQTIGQNNQLNENTPFFQQSQSYDTNFETDSQHSSVSSLSRSNSEKRHRCWTLEDDAKLKTAVMKYGERQWKEIASYVGDKSYVQCAQRWRNVLKAGIKKGHWSLEEDNLLRKAYKDTEGLRDSKRWTAVSEHVPGKTNKQCRERWNEHLRPEINKGVWTVEEDQMLLSLFKSMGSQWSKIANKMNGRTQNNVKSRWKTLNRQSTSHKTSHSASPAKLAKTNSTSSTNSSIVPAESISYPMNPVQNKPINTHIPTGMSLPSTVNGSYSSL